jgi:hypothetical protein
MSRRNASGTVEYRSIPLGDTQAEDGKLSGVAIRFNSPTQIGDPSWGFREHFAPGSLTKTLQERDVVLLDNHDQAKPIARKSAGTLRTQATDGELSWDADPVDTSYARDAAANIKAKNYGGCSVGFRAIKEDWLDDDGNPSDPFSGTQRIIREAELPEFSVVTFPAYGDTEVSARDAVTAAREARAKYTAAEKQDMLDKGQAMANSKGEPSYPIKDAEDLDNAIHAVGRGGADHDGIRKHVIEQAKKLGLSSKIPDNWNADGSLKEEDSAVLDTESREDDPKPVSSTLEIDIRSYRLRMMALAKDI